MKILRFIWSILKLIFNKGYRHGRPYYSFNGDKFYYYENRLHREDGPAIEYANGDKTYYIHGRLGRVDGPAVEFANGGKRYYFYDKLQRENDTCVHIGDYNTNLHREDGPAVEYANGDKDYYIHGKLHRIGGPAVIRGNHAEIWIDGVKISETDEYRVLIKSAKK